MAGRQNPCGGPQWVQNGHRNGPPAPWETLWRPPFQKCQNPAPLVAPPISEMATPAARLLEEIYSHPFRHIHYTWYSAVKMRIGKNTCQWLTSGSTEYCSKRCMGEYCGVHLSRLRKGGGTNPCIKCGKGTYNRFSLCQGCGYANEKANDWHRKQNAFKKEFKRLAAIEPLQFLY